MKDEREFKVGDVVTWYERSGGYTGTMRYGTITKITPAGGLTVKYLRGDETTTLRARKYHRPATHASAHQIALLMWLAEMPKGKFARMVTNYWRRGDDEVPEKLECDDVTSPLAAREAAREILKLADWWARMPVEATNDE